MTVIDLSMPIREGMQTFAAPWHPFVEVTQLGRHGIENRETRKLVLGTHTGTHVDAPRHFVPDGDTIDRVPLDRLVGPATVVDCSTFADRHPISASELERAVDGLPADRVILRFDWDAKALGTNRYYTDHAYLTEDAGRWLLDSGCRLAAMDTPQPDDPRNGRGAPLDAPLHKLLLGGGVILVEYLVNLSRLTVRRPTLVVAPLLVADGDGAPARCFAIEEAV